MRDFDLVVVGGGAAGVMAAGVAAAAGKRVLLCERMEKPQRKVRITGKGRCNLTNMRPEEAFLEKVRAGADFFAPAFHLFNNRDTKDFFEQIGVPLSIERGERVFPSSGKAWDVAGAHVRWCTEQGALIECFTRVQEVLVRNGAVYGVILENQAGAAEEVGTPRVIIATGGLSYPSTGSTGDGYMLAHRLGHTIIEVRPTLTPLVCATPNRKPLSGLALKNTATKLLVDGVAVAEEFGELEFTPFGVSGPVVLRLSRQAVDALIDDHEVALVLDLKPALSVTQLLGRIDRERSALPPRSTVQTLMGRLLPSALILRFLEVAAVRPETLLTNLTPAQSELLVHHLKAFRLPLVDYRPFEEAIATAGGVSTAEVNPETLQSRLVQGLYFAGEVLDLDADTGGFNLQIAYSTGHLAGACK